MLNTATQNEYNEDYVHSDGYDSQVFTKINFVNINNVIQKRENSLAKTVTFAKGIMPSSIHFHDKHDCDNQSYHLASDFNPKY